jgi:hypothetical protein
MAKPIKETPILYGEDAERFVKKLVENAKKKASKEELRRVMDNYSKMKSKVRLD